MLRIRSAGGHRDIVIEQGLTLRRACSSFTRRVSRLRMYLTFLRERRPTRLNRARDSLLVPVLDLRQIHALVSQSGREHTDLTHTLAVCTYVQS